ncbi:viral A-type inclusion protein, partial [Clostridium botulinum]|nr:viral A-type inclusion protein [Clostridium botulinum]
MSDIHNLEIDVDLKENLIITATCKQLDDLNLIFNVWNNGEIANLTEYKCRLKAFKQDQIPLIQNTSININNNVVNIIADEQLTTTSGIVKVELQFISKNTGKKKSTFNIVFKVMQSVLEVERSISKATCTLLKEIDNKLDRIEDIGDVLEEAKDVRDTLTNTTIPTATNINSKLENNINNASTKITEVENIITHSSNKIEEVETSVNNANTCKKELDNSSTIATTNKENLDAANALAKENIEELNKIGDAKDLAAKVETNTTDITKLKTDVEDNTSQLKDCAKQTDLDNYYSLVNATKIATGTDILTLPFGNYVSAESE